MAVDVKALIATYQRAQERIIKAILANKSVAFNSAMLRSINQELATLQGQTVAWVEKAIPAAYKEGMAAVNHSYVSQYADAGVIGPAAYPTEFATLNRNAIKVLVQNTQSDFDKAIGFVGRKVQDDIRQAGLAAVADKVATGTTVDKMRKILADQYAQQGLAAIKYQRQGKDVFMSLDSYAGMIARTTTAEATNTASMNQNQSIGGDLMQLTSHASSCPICMPLEGRVYSISGKDPDYPPLSTAFSNEYATIHPNCGHRLVPYIVDFKDEAELAADKAFSNRSFDVGEWPKAERERAQAGLEAYKRGQAKSRALYTDRRQYERYKAALGDGAPKSLSGFRAMKKADGENWQELNKKYRASDKVAVKKAPVPVVPKVSNMPYDAAAGIKDYRVKVKDDYNQIAANQGIKDYASAKYQGKVESYSKAIEQACAEGVPRVRMDGDYLSAMLDSGRFKTSVELHDTLDSHDRHILAYEKSMFGAPKELTSKRAVYGYMDHDSVRGNVTDYGDLQVTLKRARIADRTSVYTDDSMAYKGHSPFMLGDKPDVLNIHPGDLKEYKNAAEYMGHLDYLELQFHGGLGLEDIEEVLIPRERYNQYKKKGAPVLKQMDALGVKWKVQN